MGREIYRVPLDFAFPIGESFADRWWAEHKAACPKPDNCACKAHWSDSVPKGDGWQLWQTVSDGPITPVFATPEELIDYMCRPDPDAPRPFSSPGACGWNREVAEKFVRHVQWAPSGVVQGGQFLDGPTAFCTIRKATETEEMK